MTDSLKRSLGTKVRAARGRTGLTQDELGSRVGKTPESISNIERGVQTPTLDTLAALARELGVPITEFFGETARTDVVSDARVRAEARLRELVRSLDDRALELIVEQVASLARFVGTR